MVDNATTQDLHRWCRSATEGLAACIEAAPDAAVRAYPSWTVRDIALHVVRSYALATLALQSSAPERPHPELPVGREDEPPALAEAVRAARQLAEVALEDCQHDVVWTPVGVRHPSFWRRRLLREAVLHRWDAEQARGAASAPAHEEALELSQEFFDTDVARAFAEGDLQRSGVVLVRAGPCEWRVDLTHGSVTVDGEDAAAPALISGEPPELWLWLMRRSGLPRPVSIDDGDGSASAFTDLIERFGRPGC